MKSSHASQSSRSNKATPNHHNDVSKLDEFDVELLPLPRFQDRDHQVPRTRRSKCRHAQRLVEANQAVDAVNWLGAPGLVHQGSVTAAQRSALKHVWGCVSSARLCEDPLTCYGAARELLALGRQYDGACEAKLASYGEGPISLPSSDRQPVDITQVLKGSPKEFLDGFEEWLLSG